MPIPRRNLAIGVVASFALHAALLSLHFRTLPPPVPPPAESLEVVLLNVRQEAPSDVEDAQALADTAFAGGGSADEGMASSPLPAWPAPAQLPDTPPPAAPEVDASGPEPRELITRDSADEVVSARDRSAPLEADPTPDEAPPVDAEPDNAEALALAARLTQEYAALSQRLEQLNRQPRRHYFAPSTSPWMFAEYVEQWRQTVEAIGNRYYPPQLQGRIRGSLQLTVVLNADGSILDVSFDTPSVHAELNAAARTILQRAAPFAPFPDAIRQEADQLSITRTWHFENQRLSTESP